MKNDIIEFMHSQPGEEVVQPESRLQAIFDEAGPVEFDEYDDEAVKAVCYGSRIARPIQKLLITLHQIEQTRRSFGVDHAKAFEAVLPDLELLLEACKEEYRDL